MTTELWITFAGIVINAIVLVVVALIGRDQKAEHVKAEEARAKAEARAKTREEESRLSMDLMEATSELSDVIAIAVSGGKVNGNVEDARETARIARQNYHDFLRKQAAHNVAKV